jgi:hypothetical protein
MLIDLDIVQRQIGIDIKAVRGICRECRGKCISLISSEEEFVVICRSRQTNSS